MRVRDPMIRSDQSQERMGSLDFFQDELTVIPGWFVLKHPFGQVNEIPTGKFVIPCLTDQLVEGIFVLDLGGLCHEKVTLPVCGK